MSEDRRSMLAIRRTHIIVSLIVAFSMLVAGTVGALITVSTANAVSMKEYRQKIKHSETLKRKLAGVNKQLANKILELNDLTEHQIPNQVRAAQQADDQAAQARSLVESTQQRLQSAQKDKQDLEEKKLKKQVSILTMQKLL